MQKGVATKWIVFAFQDEGGSNPGEPVTGDAANITANLSQEGAAGSAVTDTNPTELEDGYYAFDISASEAGADYLAIFPQSSTANVNVIGVPGALHTRPADIKTGLAFEGIAQSASSTTLVVAASTVDDSIPQGGIVYAFGSTQGYWQSAIIDSVSGDTLTVSGWPIATPSGTITYFIILAPAASSGSPIPANVTQVGGSAQDLPTATALATVDANVDAILADTGTDLPATLATIAGYIDTEIAAIKAVTDALPNSGSLTDIASAITAIDGLIDAIKAKTDSLTFTVSNQLDSNIQSINDVTVTGNGGSGTEFSV